MHGVSCWKYLFIVLLGVKTYHPKCSMEGGGTKETLLLSIKHVLYVSSLPVK